MELIPDHPEVKVVLLTGTTELGEPVQALADDVLTKPFTLEQLASTVRRFARV